MAIRMRIIQNYDITKENEFWLLEKKFVELEKRRTDFPKGRRLKPISGSLPTNTLVWEGDFPSMEAAHAAFCKIA